MCSLSPQYPIRPRPPALDATRAPALCVTRPLCHSEAWRSVTASVQDARLSANMRPVSFVGVDGVRLSGLAHPAVAYLLEQLPGAQRMQHYRLLYHQHRTGAGVDPVRTWFARYVQ